MPGGSLQPNEIPPGTLYLLILKTLARSGEMHLRRRSAGRRGLVVPGVAAHAHQGLGDRKVGSARPFATLLESVRQAVARLNSSLPLGDTRTMNEIVGDAYSTERLALVLLTIFAVVALILAGAGVYALLAYNVSQQSREIGIRMALGALPKQILALVLQSGARLALVGVVVGIAAGIIVIRLMTRLLYQFSASNPFVFGGAAAALLGFAFLTCYVAERRATCVDPLVALRDE